MTDANFLTHLKVRAQAKRCRNWSDNGEPRCDATYNDMGVMIGKYCGHPCEFGKTGDHKIELAASMVRRLIAMAEKTA